MNHICDQKLDDGSACTYAAKRSGQLKTHLAGVHDIGVTWFPCDQKDCESKFKRKQQLDVHKVNAHNIGVKWFPCDFKDSEGNVCAEKFKSNNTLKRHYTNMHDVNRELFSCDFKDAEGIQCDYKTKLHYNLKDHKANSHDIDVVWHYCDQKNDKDENCDYKCKTSTHLREHKAVKHEIKLKEYFCDQKDIKNVNEMCKFKARSAKDVKRHKMRIHKIDPVYKYCEEKINGEKCDYKYLVSSQLKQHILHIHTKATDIPYFNCDDEKCDYKAKTKDALKKHFNRNHNPDVKWISCDQKDCKSKFIANAELKNHLESIHDIGDHKCELCIKNHNSQIKWKDPLTKKELKICKACFKKATGANSRKELVMSEYLDTMEQIRPFLVGSDVSFKSIGGCSLKRPDKLYMSPDLVLWIECDEFQHKHTNAEYTCDEKRISDSYDEFSGKKLVVIRWNPDSYKSDTAKVLFKDRLKSLKDLVLSIIETPPTELIYIYYMYYDIDNDLISRNIPYKLIQ